VAIAHPTATTPAWLYDAVTTSTSNDKKRWFPSMPPAATPANPVPV
jgi:hypothetical protein